MVVKDTMTPVTAAGAARPSRTQSHPGAHQRRPLGARAVRWVNNGGISTLVFALPMVIGFGLFAWWPIVKGVLLSFQQTNYVDSVWVGLQNFRDVFSDPLLMQAFTNTLMFAVLSILFGFPVPLLLAGTLAELTRTRRLASVLAFLPVVIPPVAGILLWKRFYSPEPDGLLNIMLGWVGLGPVQWLQNPLTALPAVVAAGTWLGMGATIIVYLAAMTLIDRDLYDAAEVDGAGIWARIWHVTLPQLRYIVLVMLLLQIISVFQIFTEPYLLTSGGPENRTVTILMLIYNRFLKGDYGGAAALSVLLAGVLLVLSLIYLRLTRKWGSSS